MYIWSVIQIQALMNDRQRYESQTRHLDALQLERNELLRQLDAVKQALFAERKHARSEKDELLEVSRCCLTVKGFIAKWPLLAFILSEWKYLIPTREQSDMTSYDVFKAFIGTDNIFGRMSNTCRWLDPGSILGWVMPRPYIKRGQGAFLFSASCLIKAAQNKRAVEMRPTTRRYIACTLKTPSSSKC